jgi:superoxide dismutase, Fe-Mn family
MALSRCVPQLRSVLGRAFSTFPAGADTVTLPELPYEYSALEPYISAEIMELHHSKHHQAYVTNYNKALEQWAEAENSQDSLAAPRISSALHFNGGGVFSCCAGNCEAVMMLHSLCCATGYSNTCL